MFKKTVFKEINYEQIIEFWFVEIDQSQWWKKDDAFDRLLRERFADLHRQAISGELYQWRESSLGRLAEIIVIDQFSRNLFRDAPQAFAYDSMALALSQEAISGGFDMQLEPEQRRFLYMPFMHSESANIHQQAEILFARLGSQSSLDFELKHKAIIDRFGRYPHRNDILGRQSAPEEIAFLETPGSAF